MIGLTGEQALLIGLLLFAIGLTAWGAATLGNPDRPLPRRPLPRPSRRWRRKVMRQARHSLEDARQPTRRLAGGRGWVAPERTGRRDLEEWVTDLYDD